MALIDKLFGFALFMFKPLALGFNPLQLFLFLALGLL